MNRPAQGRRAPVTFRCPRAYTAQLRMELLEDRVTPVNGQWLAVFGGLPVGENLLEQSQYGRNLLSAAGVPTEQISVTAALDLSGAFVLETPLDANQWELTAELQDVPGFIFVQDYEPAGPATQARQVAPQRARSEAIFGPFDYGEFTARELDGSLGGVSGGVPDQSGPVDSDSASVNVLGNNNAGSSGTAFFTQSENSILAFGNTVILGFNDSGSNAGGSNKFTGFSRSTDGGATFTDGGTLPTNANGDAGDPVLARNDTTGRIYYSTLQFSGSGINLFRSDDNGATWSAPVQAAPGKSGFQDKQWIAVDNFAGSGNGNIYHIARDFGGGNGIFFFRSTDNGLTFGPNGGTLIAAGGANNVQGAFVTVSPDHSVNVFYFDENTTPERIMTRRSTDFGVTFSAPVVVATLGTGPGFNGDLGLVGQNNGENFSRTIRSNAFPHAVVNPISGHIYVTYADKAAGTDKADIFLRVSTNSGATWSAAIKVNDDLTTNDQWQPTLAVTPDGSKLGIFYYSRQEDLTTADGDPANNQFKYYGRIANIAGATLTFAPSFAISDVASKPEVGRDSAVNTQYMGDYDQAVATPGAFHVLWSDNRSLLPGGGGRSDPNTYYKKISLGLTVTSTTPAAGSIVSVVPLNYVVNFSEPIDASTVQASDFTVTNNVGTPVPADSFLATPTQVIFTYNTAPFSNQGPHTMAMAAGSVLRLSDSSPLGAFSGTFNFDSVGLAVTGTVPPVGGVFSLPGPFTYVVNFNEEIAAGSVSTDDLTVSLGTVTAAAKTGMNQATYTIGGITVEGTLTITVGAGKLTDTLGNPNPAGFTGVYSVDVGTVPYPIPLVAKLPLGSLVYDPIATGVITPAGDTDTFTLNIDPGQTITVIVRPTVATLQPTVTLRDPSNALLASGSAPAINQDVILQTVSTTTGGVYTFTVGGVGSTTGSYSIQVFLNAAEELERHTGQPTNSTATTAQNIDPSFISLGGAASRGAVLGTVASGADLDFYSLTLAAGDTVTVALKGLSTTNVNVQLRDSSGATVLSNGIPGATNLDRVISNFLVTAAGTYYLVVSSTTAGATYDLVVTRNADFDKETNDSFATAQFIGGADGTLGALSAVPSMDGFETGNFSTFPWVTSGNANWFVTNQAAATGTFSARAGVIGASQSSSLSLTLATTAGNISFARRVSSEGSFDFQRFSIDGVQVGSWSGIETSFTTVSFPVSAGTHTFTWSYTKDGSVDSGLDTAFIDNVVFPLPSDTEDWYSFAVNAGDSLNLQTVTPADGTGEFVNTLNPKIELYNPSNGLVASGTTLGDARNEQILHTAAATGLYRVRVLRESGTIGEYFVSVAGNTGAAQPAFAVTTTTPANGALLLTSPTIMTVNFNDAYLATTVQASDLQVDGVNATAFTIVDGDTLNFFLPGPLGAGSHTVTIAAGAILDVQGTPLGAFTSTFFLDNVAPRVTTTSIAPGAVLVPGSVSYQVTFSEPMRVANLTTDDFSLRGNFRNLNYSSSSFSYNLAGTVVTLNYVGLPDDNYTLTLFSGVSGGSNFTDAVGNALDGEFVGTFPSGNGVPGGNFLIGFNTDPGAVSEAYPALVAELPAGSLIYDPSLIRTVAFAGDTDSFTLNVDPGQTITVLITPNAAGLQPTVQLLNPANAVVGSATATAAGQKALIQTVPTSSGGTYTISVSGAGGTIGGYTAQVILNAALENEAHVGPSNNTRATAQDIGPSFITLQTPQASATRGAVSGQLAGNDDYYAFELGAGESVTVGMWKPPTVTGLFGAATAIPVSLGGAFVGPLSLTYADLNGDGKQDMVTGNWSAGTASVLLGNGNGTFGTPTQFSLGTTSSWTIALGDVNGDGKHDIVSANTSFSTVSVLLGNGNGTFGIAAVYTVGSSPYSVAVGDLNGDGRGDVVTANYGSSDVTVRLGSASGVLGAPINYFVNSGPIGVKIADLNGDSKLDVVTANWNNSSMGVLLGNGTGVLGTPVTYPMGANPYDIALGDVNGDGKLDAVTGNYSGNSVSVRFGDGLGGFGAVADYSSGGTNPQRVAVGDVNNDGKADIAVANLGTSTVGVLLSSGSGTLGTAQTFVTGSSPYGVALADVNGDGLLDLSTANYNGNNVTQFLNISSGIKLEVLDGSGTVVATTTTAANLDAVLTHVASAAGTYYARVSGTGSNPYNLVVTRDAVLDTEANNTFATAQSIGGTQGALGHVVGGGAAGLFDLTGPTVTGPIILSGSKITLGFNPDGSFITAFGGTGIQYNGTEFVVPGTPLASFTVGYSGLTFTNNGANSVSQITGITRQDISSGSAKGLRIVGMAGASVRVERVVLFNQNDDFATIATRLTNLSGASLTNVASLENLDPDQDFTAFSNFSTNNDVVLGGQFVRGTGPSSGLTIGLGSADTRSVVSAEGFDTRNPFDIINTPVDPNGANGDIAIAQAFNFGGLAASGQVSAIAIMAFGTTAAAADTVFSNNSGGTTLSNPDWYSINVTSTANALRLETSTPADGPGEFVNLLNPKIELYDPSGVLVASGLAMADGRNEFIQYAPLTTGLYRVQVVGQSGTSGEYFLSKNFSPVVTSVTGATIDENGTATVTGTISDPDSLDTHTVVITWGPGEGSTTLTLAAGVTAFSASHQYLDDNPTGTLSDVYPIGVTVTDNHGAVGTGETTVTVNTVAPAIDPIVAPSSGVRGQPLPFAASFTDVGLRDTHQVSWDFGDGTGIDFHHVTEGGALTPSHAYTMEGTYTVTLSVRDDDRGTASVTKTVTISAVALQPDPSDPTLLALVVGGTTEPDVISFQASSGGTVKLTFNGQLVGTYAPTGGIIVYGQAGDDIISVNNVPRSAWLFGGDGNDELNGGSRPDVILGGSGNDHIHGNGGRDILIAGAGADELFAGTSDDILIDGTTLFDGNLAALNAIQDEWNSSRNFLTRVRNLRGDANSTFGDRLNGTYFLEASFGATVFADASPDHLDGEGNNCWFFGDLDGTTPDETDFGAADVLEDVDPVGTGRVGPVAAYNFDVTEGTALADITGNAHNGTISGAAWSLDGHSGGALSFDGIDDMVTVDDAAALDLTTGMTLMAWVRPAALSDWSTVLLKETAGLPSGLSYGLYAHSTQANRPGAYVNTGGLDQSANGTAKLALNTWSHLTATYDGLTLRMYVNGTAAGTRTVTNPLLLTGSPLRIGGNAIWGEFFNGLIDDVRVYDRALSGAEIQQDLGTPVGATPGGTKFFVADAAAQATFRYASDGSANGAFDLDAAAAAPRGIASNEAGNTLWVIDSTHRVVVQGPDGSVRGSWLADGLTNPQDITTDGVDVWVVDATQDKVFRYAGAAGLTGGTATPGASFALHPDNASPTGIVTAGALLWVTDDVADAVFVYDLAGTLRGRWALDTNNADPSGITLNPTSGLDLWVVDRVDGKVYEYANALLRRDGSQAASATFALSAGNTQPEGIADPILSVAPALPTATANAGTTAPVVVALSQTARNATPALASPEQAQQQARPSTPIVNASATVGTTPADLMDPLESYFLMSANNDPVGAWATGDRAGSNPASRDAGRGRPVPGADTRRSGDFILNAPLALGSLAPTDGETVDWFVNGLDDVILD